MFKNSGIKYISLVTGIAITLSLSVIMSSTTQQTVSANKPSQSHESSKAALSKGKEIEKPELKQELSHEQIVSLTGAFMDKLLQETDDSNKVIHYSTKNALLKEFEKIASNEVAAEYVGFYFKERTDGLYIKPTETPPWFQENNDYDMIKQDNNTVLVIQKNKSDLYGTYSVKFEFTWENNQWKISNINHN
ncbi:MAG TPA: hypothetical protein VK097_09785 [Lentibacillus sp.]|uniref:hypothetical protein n=1 Tax=Lentibacillus sp. TaxID=1925746 RepID=UPI002B4AEDBE|nr:hypothetical protein [Lentibacillus sp.]HLR62717.1 hypothetical protein [Lentibacillus sp.]